MFMITYKNRKAQVILQIVSQNWNAAKYWPLENRGIKLSKNDMHWRLITFLKEWEELWWDNHDKRSL